MEYLVPGLVLVVAVGIGVTLMTVVARRRAGTGPDDESPFGDTPELAGEQREGETVSGQDAEGSGDGGDRDDLARPVVGGEGEGTRRVRKPS